MTAKFDIKMKAPKTLQVDIDFHNFIQEVIPMEKKKVEVSESVQSITGTDIATETEAAPKSDGSKMGQASVKTRSRKQAIKDAQQREAARERRTRENAMFLGGWSGLQSAQKLGTIMYGTVSGIEVVDFSGRMNPDIRNAVMVVLIHNGIYRVTIPFSELYRDYPIDMSTVSVDTELDRKYFIARQKAMAEKLYGLEVPFVVLDMFIDDGMSGKYSILASRAKALAVIERRNFDPDKEGNVALNVGDFVPATITSISDYAVAVNVGGVDTRVSVNRLTYKFIAGPHSLRSMYRVGQEIMVQILNIKKNKEGNHSIIVSARPAELLEAKGRQNIIVHEEEQCFGTVTGVLKSRVPGEVYITLYLDAYGLPAVTNSFPPNRMGTYPQPGDTVRVTIKAFNNDGMTYCWIRSSHGAPNLTPFV